MRYVQGRIQKDFDDWAYRIYISDAIKTLGHLNVRYFDLIDRTPADTRTQEEVVDHISECLSKL